MEFTSPKHFNINAVEEYLKKIEVAFSWQGKMVPGITIKLSNIQKISIIGLLLIYKFIDYTYINHCFKKANLEIGDETPIIDAWHKYEFFDLIKAYISNQDETDKAYKRLKVKVEDQFIIAPQALLRQSNFTEVYLKKEFLPKIESYYSHDKRAIQLIFTCLSEILLNFWEHAVEDTKSIILADGNKDKIEIACADTGNGIITNLNPLFPNLASKPELLLAKAFEKGVTSKGNTNHMGYGLWIVNEIIKLNRGKLHVYSQGYFYKNDYGKIRIGKCGYWPGTIIYTNIDLRIPKTIADIESIKSIEQSILKINFA